MSPTLAATGHILDEGTFGVIVEAFGRAGTRDLLLRFEAQMRAAFDRLDQPPERLSASAHELLNAAGMLGFSAFSAACRRLHDQVRRGEDISADLPDFARLRDATLAVIERLQRD